MNNVELQKVLKPVNLVPITLANLRLMLHKSDTDDMNLSLLELATLQRSLRGIVLRVEDEIAKEQENNENNEKTEKDSDLNDFIVSIEVRNIMFAMASDKRYIFCINVPNDTGYSDAELILISGEDGIFSASEDGIENDISIKEAYFVF